MKLQNHLQKTFLFSGGNIFNELPTEITEAADIETFCRRFISM